jgi:hypothetical protein
MNFDLKRFAMFSMAATCAVRVIIQPISNLISHQYSLLVWSFIGVAIGVWILRAFWKQKKWAWYFLGYAYSICGLLGLVGEMLPPREEGVKFVFMLLEDLWYATIGILAVWTLHSRLLREGNLK